MVIQMRCHPATLFPTYNTTFTITQYTQQYDSNHQIQVQFKMYNKFNNIIFNTVALPPSHPLSYIQHYLSYYKTFKKTATTTFSIAKHVSHDIRLPTGQPFDVELRLSLKMPTAPTSQCSRTEWIPATHFALYAVSPASPRQPTGSAHGMVTGHAQWGQYNVRRQQLQHNRYINVSSNIIGTKKK